MGAQGALRRDAERNRRQLVETAKVVFAERGLEAPLDEIARRAKVGNATLYRRFPSRGLLVAAVFEDALREVVAATERALAVSAEDPWAAFAEHLTFLCEVQAGSRAIADLLTATVSGVPELETLRGRAFRGLTALIDRARAAGVLRPDFQHEDVVPVLMANAGLVERTAESAPTAWRRQLGYTLAGLRAPAKTPAEPAPDRVGILRAMHALAERNGLTS
ncbi:TetR/AcrR family transcriptional regulator [Dactylosporangium matsuzakiense]|uniref:TetR family transcriptional regulator n=1 Tax=Dactylosporangium matsuzakiense TaxID=53360 RepID=A0A9W6NKS7_9ACTN|nr:TetR/AcrR family transcriptional regulator [Dactylosporangium matsuzakiense]UWZ45600.1 TetR/AcrR family transcriptional regulator [Dactylosporangium matsuzakiense]GLL00388.1 TetR family transcriptional regulator [Dactylosporangium matsuzakiense]